MQDIQRHFGEYFRLSFTFSCDACSGRLSICSYLASLALGFGWHLGVVDVDGSDGLRCNATEKTAIKRDRHRFIVVGPTIPQDSEQVSASPGHTQQLTINYITVTTI